MIQSNHPQNLTKSHNHLESCGHYGHLELSHISKNEELINIQEKLYLQLEFIQAVFYHQIEPIDEQYNQHKEIVYSLFNRDTEKLVNLLLVHEKKFHNLQDLDHTENYKSIYKDT